MDLCCDHWVANHAGMIPDQVEYIGGRISIDCDEVDMLKSLSIKNLTVFAEADLEFSPQLNVFVGENGSGKTHVLKVAYAVLGNGVRPAFGEGPSMGLTRLSKEKLQTQLAETLVAVLRPDSLGRLVRRGRGRERCEMAFSFASTNNNLSFSFAAQNKSEVSFDKFPSTWSWNRAVFLPTRELLTIYPGFVSIYESHYLEFEETWRDTCLLLGRPAVRGEREAHVKELLAPLETSMGGTVELGHAGRFYLQTLDVGTIEMPLVAEGIRKIAMLAQLIATGSLLQGSYLFWDEPDANLNPKLIKEIAFAILHLCNNGVQVFIATHSLFLMRELHIQLQRDEFRDTAARFFGLHIGDNGVNVQQGDSIDDIGEIAALNEELSQSDRYLGMEA